MEWHLPTLEGVKLLHARQIDLYGGLHGIRDEGLLSSAIAVPKIK